MPALFERTFDQLMADSMTDVMGQTNINFSSPGGKARAQLEAVNRRLNQAYKTFDRNLVLGFLSGAQGRYLDLLGELLGTPRANAEAASADQASQTQLFYVEVGTFGDINSGQPILLPRGTIISANSGLTGITYRTVLPVVLAAADNETYIPIEATSPGEDFNVGQNSLIYHDFTSYTDTGNDTLKTKNVKGLVAGKEVEGDLNYRFRLSNAVLSAETGNQTAIRLAALLVPGVADLVLLPYFSGIGTYRLLIKSITPSVPTSLIQAVQAAIEDVTSYGLKPVAAKPKESGLEFKITLVYRKKLPASERDLIEGAVKDSLTDYVNSLDIGDSFIVNEAVERVLGVSNNILDMGVAGKPFDNIYVWKETDLSDNKIREELLGNYVPSVFERIIIEPSVAEPITISRSDAPLPRTT